jgi:hypothetical protein
VVLYNIITSREMIKWGYALINVTTLRNIKVKFEREKDYKKVSHFESSLLHSTQYWHIFENLFFESILKFIISYVMTRPNTSIYASIVLCKYPNVKTLLNITAYNLSARFVSSNNINIYTSCLFNMVPW